MTFETFKESFPKIVVAIFIIGLVALIIVGYNKQIKSYQELTINQKEEMLSLEKVRYLLVNGYCRNLEFTNGFVNKIEQEDFKNITVSCFVIDNGTVGYAHSFLLD